MERISDFSPDGRRIAYYTGMKYKPQVLRSTVEGRKNSTFLYIRHGVYLYTFEGGNIRAGEGDIVYVPKGGHYTYDIPLPEETFTIQMEFDIFDGAGEPVTFAPHPTVALSGASRETAALFESVVSAILGGTDLLYTTGNFLLLLSEIAKRESRVTVPVPSEKIQTAVEYLRYHFTEPVSVAYLAKLCYLSETHFRRLFARGMGMSAIRYKNRLLTDAAKKLLHTEDRTVGEIADALGYPSVYAFSQTFRRECGISPTAYRASVLRTEKKRESR